MVFGMLKRIPPVGSGAAAGACSSSEFPSIEDSTVVCVVSAEGCWNSSSAVIIGSSSGI